VIRAFDAFSLPLLRWFDPEDAHRMAIQGLKLLPPVRSKPDDAKLALRAFGLNFPNPVGLAAGVLLLQVALGRVKGSALLRVCSLALIPFIAFAVWGYASWSTMGLTFPSDLFPQDVVASVTGLSGFGAGLAGTLFTLAVGKLVDKFSYFPAFFAAATLPLLATAAVLFLPSPRTESTQAQSARVRK